MTGTKPLPGCRQRPSARGDSFHPSRTGCFFAALSTWLDPARRWGGGEGPQTHLGGLTQGKASSPSCAAAPDGPRPHGETGTGLCCKDLSPPGSSDARDGVPGDGVKPWVLRSCNLLTDTPPLTLLSPPSKHQTKKQLQQRLPLLFSVFICSAFPGCGVPARGNL